MDNLIFLLKPLSVKRSVFSVNHQTASFLHDLQCVPISILLLFYVFYFIKQRQHS